MTLKLVQMGTGTNDNSCFLLRGLHANRFQHMHPPHVFMAQSMGAKSVFCVWKCMRAEVRNMHVELMYIPFPLSVHVVCMKQHNV